MFYGLAAVPIRTGQRNVYFSLGRSLGREDYDSQDVAVMQTLLPHLVTALRVSDRLAAAEVPARAASAALDRLDTGVILVDAAGRIVFANGVAELMLSANDAFRSGRDGLRACDPHASRVLRRLIARCANVTLADGGAGGAVDVERGEGRAPLHVVVAPFRVGATQTGTPWLGAAQPVAMLMVTDPERERRAKNEDLRLRFGLTAAEADVASEILKGDGRDAVAARLGVSMATVRTHLSHIFEKTGVRRQAELVRLLMDGERCSGEH